MWLQGLWAPLLLAAGSGGAQDDTLARIRASVAERLSHQPNYTCTETVERHRLRDQCDECETRDRLRLEVVVLDQRERFAWPGAPQFSDDDLRELVGSGTVESGDFWGFARAVFVTGKPVFTPAGRGRQAGHRTLRYDYAVTAADSGFYMAVGRNGAMVAFRGSFWVDPATLDLLRLEVNAVDVPARVGIVRSRMVTDYRRVRIGSTGFVLPRATDLSVEHRNGLISRNRTRYTNCRQYMAESAIRFEAATDGGYAPDSAAASPERMLPAGLRIQTKLSAGLDLDRAAIGDPVGFVVSAPVQSAGTLWMEKGAHLVGRIVRLEDHLRPRRFTLLGLEFQHFVSGSARFRFHARAADSIYTWQQPVEALREYRGAIYFVHPNHRRLARDSRFDWITTLPQ